MSKATKKKASKKKATRKKAPARKKAPVRRASQVGELGDGSTLKLINKRAKRIRRDSPSMTQQKAVKEAAKQLRAEGKIGGKKMLPARRRTSSISRPARSAKPRSRRSAIATAINWLAPWSTDTTSRHSGRDLSIAAAMLMQIARLYDALYEMAGNNRKSEAALEMLIEPQIVGMIEDAPNTPVPAKTLLREFFQQRNLLILRMDPQGRVGGYHRGLDDFLGWLNPNDRLALLRYLADWRNENDRDDLSSGRQGVAADLQEADVVAQTLAAMYSLQTFPDASELNGGQFGGRNDFGRIHNVGRMGWPHVPRSGQMSGVPYGQMMDEPDDMADVRASMAHGEFGASPSTIDLFLTLDDPFALSRSGSPLGDGSGIGFDADIRPEDQPFSPRPAGLFGDGGQSMRTMQPTGPMTAEELDSETGPDVAEATGFVPIFEGGELVTGDDGDGPESTFF